VRRFAPEIRSSPFSSFFPGMEEGVRMEGEMWGWKKGQGEEGKRRKVRGQAIREENER